MTPEHLKMKEWFERPRCYSSGSHVMAMSDRYGLELLAELDRLESALAKSEAERFDLTFNAQSDRKAFEAMLEKIGSFPRRGQLSGNSG